MKRSAPNYQVENSPAGLQAGAWTENLGEPATVSTTYKIHPAIGIARVGNSDDYYQAPRTTGGLPLEKDGSTPVTQFRDSQQRIKRQAVAFSIYAYDDANPRGRLINLARDGIVEIEWTVYLANKKAAWREFRQLEGEDGYASDHPYRNPLVTGDDRKQLIIDPGPQTVRCVAGPYHADFARGKGQPGYPQTFPPPLKPYNIDTLGELQTNPDGSIFVVGGYGNAGVTKPYTLSPALLDSLPDADDRPVPAAICAKLTPIQNNAYDNEATLRIALQPLLTTAEYTTYQSDIIYHALQPRIDTYANNNYWFDDVSDGPVTATLVLKDGTRVPVDDPAWVLVAPPGYAPQILNMVTLYDTMYDVFVRNLGYNPALYANGAFLPDYQPNVAAEIQPILDRPAAYRWVAGINPQGVRAHNAAQQDPDANFFDYLRKPGAYNQAGQMPQLAGDNPISNYDRRNYLTLTQTQYFLLSQFNNGQVNTDAPADNTGDGEKLDRASLENCVGGPFCPGIEMTWICRNPIIYSKPFRLKHKKLTGTGLSLSEDLSQGLEPGDVSRYMALPWQADFNECSDQTIDNKYIWWWPAQRPYQVYTPEDPTTQVYWVRPYGDNFTYDVTMVYNWKDLGFIVETPPGSSTYLEVQRLPLEHSDSNG